jgi:hypothetical protein
VAVGAFLWTDSSVVRWWTCIALAATVLAFAGTTQALPALMKLRHTADDETALAQVLDRFARWHTISTVWQVVSFVALVVALADYPTT